MDSVKSMGISKVFSRNFNWWIQGLCGHSHHAAFAVQVLWMVDAHVRRDAWDMEHGNGRNT